MRELKEIDVKVGAQLLCIESKSMHHTVGETYTITPNTYLLDSMWPYRITTDVPIGDLLTSYEELSGKCTEFNTVKFVLASTVTDEELFLFRMSGRFAS